MNDAYERYLRECEAEGALPSCFETFDRVRQEAIRRPADAQATRFATNPNWTYRGDNTKYREKK